jgi:uncharacterized membrane protein
MTKPVPAPVKASYVGTWIATLLLVVTFVFGLLLFPPYFEAVEGMAEAPRNVLFFGRFHPILVHLPIGILIFLLVMEMLCMRKSVEAKFGEAALLALWIGAAGSVFAVLAGIMLSREGGYEGGSFTLHQGLGIIGTAGILLGLLMRLAGMSTQNSGLVDAYRAVLILSFSLMGVGAHFGANMVHGSKYMTQYAPPVIAEQITGMEKWMLSLVEEPKGEEAVVTVEPEKEPKKEEVKPVPVAPAAKEIVMAPEAPPPSAPVKSAGAMIAGAEGKLVFEHLVLPVLEEKCNKCHNAEKSKGDLRLDTHEMVMKGGKTEGNVVAGNPAGSLLISRIKLPEDDDEHMPPEGKPQISPEELALLSWWIEQGASETLKINDSPLPAETQSLVQKLLPTP